MLTQQAYYDIKHLIAPGDIIAFGGTSLFSRWTKLTTRSVVTHTALVIDSPDDNRSISAAQDLTMIEATSIKGKKGVMHNYVEERISHLRLRGRRTNQHGDLSRYRLPFRRPRPGHLQYP